MRIALDLDLSGVLDIQDTAIEASGYLAFAQSLARRLITKRGTLIDDPNYGIDVRDWLNLETTPKNARLLSAQAASELRKDDRVVSATVTVTYGVGTMSLRCVVRGTELPVVFTLNVSDVTVELLTENT